MKPARQGRRLLPLLAALISLAWAASSAAGEWRWRERLDFSILHDSNIFETVSAAEEDRAGRLLGHFDGRCRLSPRVAVAIAYDGGLEIYGRHNEENRLASNLRLQFDGRLSSRLTTGVELHGRSKRYFDAARGFSFYRATPHLTWQSSKRVRYRLFGHVTWLDHDRGEHFDYRQLGVGLRCDVELGKRFTTGLRLAASGTAFDRLAVDYVPDDPPVHPWIVLAEDQSDDQLEAALTVEFYRWLLVQGEVSVATNRSNAWGYAYDQTRVRLLCVKTLPWELTLRFYWTLRSKNYTEDLEPALKVRPDSENEESDHVLVDMARDLGPKTSLRLRFGRYRNESPFRDRYYEKTVVSVGVTRRF